MTSPLYIALCGKPTVGKDTVAKILSSRMKAAVIDDGLPLRLAAPHLFGFNPAHPFSQEGKLKQVAMPNGEGTRTVRDCLGTLGALLEQEFGEFVLPARAVALAEQTWRTEGTEIFIFPSVRRNQGQFYKDRGGFVVEIKREVSGSPYAFDNDYDRSCIDFTIDNSGTFEDLHDEVSKFIRDFQERLAVRHLRREFVA